MTKRIDSYADIAAECDDPRLARVIHDLDSASRAPAPPAHLRASVLHMARQRSVSTRASHWPRNLGLRRWRVPLVASLLLALSGAAGYMRLSAPTPVSAQTVLRSAAAHHLTANQVTHFTYTVTVSGAMASGSGKGTGPLTDEVWIQSDATGAIVASAQTLAGGSRYIEAGQQSYAYDAGHNAILLPPEQRGVESWVVPSEILDGADVAAQLSVLAQRSPQQVQLRPQQVLDGRRVDVVEVDGWTARPGQRTTLYFDAQDHTLRGFDAASQDPSYPTPTWQVRLVSEAVVAAQDVPSSTFILNAPADASVELPQPDLRAIVTGMCHITTNPKYALRSGASLLAICQAGNPSVTSQELLDAFMAPAKAAMDAAVSAGQITPAQEARGLADAQARFTALISGHAGT